MDVLMMTDSVFSKLPPEMLCAIFEKLNFKTILECRQVCHKWQTLLDSYFIKTNIILNNANYSYVKKSNLEARTLTVRDFWTDCSTESKSVSRCSLARKAKHVIFGSANANYQSSVRSERRRLTQENMVLILMLNPEIESIIFEENSLKYIQSLNTRGIPFQHVTCLSIDFSYATDRKVFQDLVETKFPVLKSVQLSEYWSEFGPERGRGYVGMYRFLGNHKKTLRFVTLVHPMRSQDAPVHNLQLLPPKKMEALMKDLSEIQLSSLYLYFVSIEGSGNFTLGGRLLQSQRKLTKLQVAIGGNYFYCLPQVKNALERNSDTLEYVSILSHEQWGVFVSLSDTLSPLSFCSKLDTLEIDHFFVSSIPIIPSSVRILTITGYVLVENIFPLIIASNLTNLEQFSYADMSSHPYITEEDMNNFKRLIGLPKIKRLKICKEHMLGEFEEFLDELEGVSWDVMDTEVTFRDNFLPFYDISVNRVNQVRQHETS